jgi:hypothetical protein
MKQAKDFNTCIKNMVRSIGRTKDLGGRALKSLDGERSSGKSRGDDVGGWGRERQRNTHTHMQTYTKERYREISTTERGRDSYRKEENTWRQRDSEGKGR